LHQIKLEAINLARIEYSAHQLVNVSPERLQRFFTKLKINIAFVNPCEMFVFFSHNILSDPPFSKWT
jgi:two-component system CheB/CheR fusion protein